MLTSEKLEEGAVYTRQQLTFMFGITDRTVYNGVFRPAGHESIWIFVTEKKPKDRTQFKDRLEGDTLYWEGQLTGRTDHLITNHEPDGAELLIFYRMKKYEHPGAGFGYMGRFRYKSHAGAHPTQFVLVRDGLEEVIGRDLEAMQQEEAPIFEGALGKRYINVYERKSKLRAAAVRIHGTVCRGCGFNFETAYGPRGREYIEVHHLLPVSELNGTAAVDPEKDMTVLCSNCHRMVHRRKDDILSLEQLKALVGAHGNSGGAVYKPTQP